MGGEWATITETIYIILDARLTTKQMTTRMSMLNRLDRTE